MQAGLVEPLILSSSADWVSCDEGSGVSCFLGGGTRCGRSTVFTSCMHGGHRCVRLLGAAVGRGGVDRSGCGLGISQASQASCSTDHDSTSHCGSVWILAARSGYETNIIISYSNKYLNVMTWCIEQAVRLVWQRAVRYTKHMVKQSSSKKSAKKVDFEPNKMSFAIAAAASTCLVLLAVIAMQG
jgi:hypothetical protein